MSFWNLSDGNKVEENDSFGVSSGSVLPTGDYIAVIKDVEWKSYQDNPEYIQITWQVIKPEKFANMCVFHKIHINDEKQSRADNAKRMLAAIDHNCGGKLSKSEEKPDSLSLKKALSNKILTIRVEIWEIDDKKGNWVSKVAPKAHSVPEPKPSTTTDEDVPF